MSPVIREVQAPYLVNPEDEALGRETIFIRRDGEIVAAVVPYAEYQAMAGKPTPSPLPVDPDFEKQWKAFQRLLPNLLGEHLGKWVGIVNERVAVIDDSSSAVLAEIVRRFGDVPMCIQEVTDPPRVYRFPSIRIYRPPKIGTQP